MENASLDTQATPHRFEQSMQQLIEAIAAAPYTMQGSLLAVARKRLEGAQLDVPTVPSTDRRSRGLRRKFQRGVAIHRREDEEGLEVPEKEWLKGLDLFYGAITEIILTGIHNERELKTVYDALEYVMKREKFEGSIENAIDYALCAAYEVVETSEAAWFIGLARFRLRGFNAPPWEYPADQGLFVV